MARIDQTVGAGAQAVREARATTVAGAVARRERVDTSDAAARRERSSTSDAGVPADAGEKRPILELRGVRKAFGGNEVLHDIDLTVSKGEVVAILGPSGSGKTTLLRCANFLERADAGELVLNGVAHDLAQANRREANDVRRHTAFVFQAYNLFRNRTVLGNVTEGLVTARRVGKAEARDIAVSCLERVGMADRLDSFPAQLSGGQQQRVAIARAMATNPEVIYFDEPTSALDPELTVEVLGVMRALAQDGMTMVVVTHEMGFAQNVADRVVFMEDGVVAAQAPAREFFERPTNDRVRAFLDTVAPRSLTLGTGSFVRQRHGAGSGFQAGPGTGGPDK